MFTKVYLPERTIYLAGAVECIPWHQASEWRAFAQEFLQENDKYTVINPLEGKSNSKKYDYNPKEIVTQDLANVQNSDVIIVENHFPSVPRWGTAMEVREAFLHNKSIYTWGQAHAGYFLRHHTTLSFPSLEQLLAHLVPAKLCERTGQFCVTVKLCSSCDDIPTKVKK